LRQGVVGWRNAGQQLPKKTTVYSLSAAGIAPQKMLAGNKPNET
jgi:hypothetical protein